MKNKKVQDYKIRVLGAGISGPSAILENKLSSDFTLISNYSNIMDAVKVGENIFSEDVKKINFPQINTSAVHSYHDLVVQAFIVAIPSYGNVEMALKAYMAFASHFLDDFFDRPDYPPSFSLMKKYRGDIGSLISNMGFAGKFADLMSLKAMSKHGFYKGLHRLAYGGLIQQSETERDQLEFLNEYKSIGKDGINNEICKDIDKIRNIAYWMTTKTIQELIWSPEENVDFNLAELWSIAFSPAIYYHDHYEEENKGELNFFSQQKPQISEMKAMIDISLKYLNKINDKFRKKRIFQLQYLRKSFKCVFPQEIDEAYDKLERSLE